MITKVMIAAAADVKIITQGAWRQVGLWADITRDADVVDLSDGAGFIAVAKTRQSSREAAVNMLA